MYFGMFVVTLYIATERSSWLIIGLLLFFGGAVLAWSLGQTIGGPFANFALRVDVWLHPFADANDTGYQLVQSLLGLGTGGLFGAGPGNGLPYLADLPFPRYVVPEVQNDFIFAGLGEEIGLFGLTALLVAYLLIIQRGLRTAVTVRDSFGKLMAGGLAFTLGLQVFVIIGGVSGLIPLTGQTTPYLSAGGSSLMANWLLLALLVRISDAARRPVTAGPSGGTLAPPPPPVKLAEAPTEVVAVNAPLRKAGVVMMILFGLLFLNLNCVQVIKADEYRTDEDHNRIRVQAQEYERRRGKIIVDGVAVAQSEETKDDLKFQRKYQFGPTYANIVGYRPVNLAAVGIERLENEFLSGTADSFAADRLLEMFTGRDTPGGSVVLSLRKQVQEAAYKALLNNATSSKVGAVVALDPITGAILAMVSTPSYDPNPLVSHDFDVARQAFAKLEADPAKPLLNRAVQETFPPGSTFKVVVAAAALRNGLNPSSVLAGGSSYTAPDTTTAINNAPGVSCPDEITLADALRVSCNTAFARLWRGATRRGQAEGDRAGVRVRVGAGTRAGPGQRVAGGRQPHRSNGGPWRLDRPAGAGAVVHRPARGADDPAAGCAGRGGDRQQRRTDAPLPHRHVAGVGPGAEGAGTAQGSREPGFPGRGRATAHDDGWRGDQRHRHPRQG